MTKDEFIAVYCARSEMTRDEFVADLVALPCACGYEGCEGWAAVLNEPDIVRNHNRVYGPRDEANEG